MVDRSINFLPIKGHHFWSNLDRMREGLSLTDAELSESMGLSRQRFRTLRTMKKAVPAASAFMLEEFLNISFPDLFNKSFDAETAVKRKINPRHISDRHLIFPKSRARTSLVPLSFLSFSGHGYQLNRLLNSCHISEHIFEDHGRLLSMNMIIDIFKYLEKNSYSKNDFYQIGKSAWLVNSDFTSKINAHCNSPSKLFEYLCEEAAQVFDANFKYQVIKSSRDQMTIRLHQRDDVNEALGCTKLGSPSICTYKAGVMETLWNPSKEDSRRVSVRETKCIHHDAPYCEYNLKFYAATRSSE